MRRTGAFLFGLFAAVAFAQGAGEDELSHAFGPPPPAKPFESERNVPAPPLPVDPNATARAAFEKDFATAALAVKALEAAAARDQLALLELSAFMLGGPERVRVHKLQREVALALGDREALKVAEEKWLAACGPGQVAACRTEALEALAGRDRARAEKVRAADACLTAAEKAPGKAAPACLDSARALYRKAEDSLMVARVDLVRALALAADGKQSRAARKALASMAAVTDERLASVRSTALETLSRFDLAEGATDAALREALLGAAAWASTQPPERRPWARTAAVDAACAAYEKGRGAGACRFLEKQLTGDYLFHDFSQEHLPEEQLISHDKLVEVNEHYGVLIQDCLAEEIANLGDTPTTLYRVNWLVIHDGRVDNFHSESTQQDQSRFVRCLRNQFGYWRYPTHQGDPQRIEQTFSVKSITRRDVSEGD